MSAVSSINPDFKLNPYLHGRVYHANLTERLKLTCPDIDWQARKVRAAVDYLPQGLLSLPWCTTPAQWADICNGQGRAPAGRRVRGLEQANDLNWPAAATELQIAVAKSDFKQQTTLVEQVPKAKLDIMDLALSECPEEFASSFRKLPILDQTMLRLLTDIRAQYFELPQDQVIIMHEQMHEPWNASIYARVFTQRLSSLKNSMDPVY